MTETEDKIKSITNNYCRVCKHYMRVNFDTIRNVTNRQGFCLLGQLEGDYGLYISSSKSKECFGFVYDEQNYTITTLENKLSDDCDDFLRSIEDKRTTNYKLSKPLLDAQTNYIKVVKSKPGGHAFFEAAQNLRTISVDTFVELNIDRYKKVYYMVSLKRPDYLKFLAHVSVELHNRFCSCDCVELKNNTKVNNESN